MPLVSLCVSASLRQIYLGCGLFLLCHLEQLDLGIDLHFLADQHAARLQGSIPVQTPILTVDLGAGAKADVGRTERAFALADELGVQHYRAGYAAFAANEAEKAARILSVTGQGKLGILDADKAAAVLAEAKTAKQVLLIDGCENGCGMALAREAGLDCDYLAVTDLGLAKGSAAADGKNFDLVVAAAREILTKS